MKKIKLISSFLAAAMLVQCAAFSVFADNTNAEAAGATVIANDIDTDWTLNWSWERSEDGFMYHTDWQLEDGYKMDFDKTKLNELLQYAYAKLDGKYIGDMNGKSEGVYKGEYKVFYRTDSEGNLVKYDENDTTSTEHTWYHQGRLNYAEIAQFKVGEETESDQPLVISYTYKSTNKEDQWWGSGPATAYIIRGEKGVAFRIFPNNGQNKGLKIQCNDGYKELGLARDYDYHDVKLVISPELTDDGRYQMTAISVDGVVTKLENVYGMTAEATNKLSRITQASGTWSTHTDEMKNLVVERGFNPMTASTEFVDGSELTADGIDITASEILDKDTLDVTVYDCDFGDDVISDPGMVVTNNGKNVNIKFTKLEAGGNYRAEITGIQDVFGNAYNDTLSISFKTPADSSEGGGDVDDTPNDEGSGTEIGIGDIKRDSSLFHGYQFTTFSQENGEYEVRVDSKGWYEAEQNRYAKNGAYYYLKDGVETYLGSDDAWNRIDLTINVGETENPKKPLVVSFDWYAENSGGAYEWGSNFVNAMGVQCYIPSSTNANSLLKYYKDGLNKTETTKLKGSEDGWHSYKLVFGSDLTEGRPQLTAAIVDGEITFYNDVYSMSTFKSEDEYKIKGVTLQITNPSEAKAANGDTVVKIKNLSVERVDGLEAELFMPLKKQNPKEDIKLNFNYPIPDKLTAEDFSIFEVNGDEVTEIPNTLTISKAYGNKQVIVNVGDGGLYYDKEYKLVINKNIVVNDYIGVGKKSYDFTTYEYPDDLAVEATKSGNTINYTISGGDEDSFVIMAATYDKDGALVGLNRAVATKQGSGNRRKAKGSIDAENTSADTTVNMYIFTADGMTIHRMPTELQ